MVGHLAPGIGLSAGCRARVRVRYQEEARFLVYLGPEDWRSDWTVWPRIVICNCICKVCTFDAGAPGTPTLCLACALMDALGSQDHGVPYTPPVWKPIEPSVPISDKQKDAAIKSAVAEDIGL